MSKNKSPKKIRVKLVRSVNGAKQPHKRTVRALGLTRMQSEVTKEATPQVLGMVRSIVHLVEVSEAE
jgi:large subunit ribosomal protein L30